MTTPYAKLLVSVNDGEPTSGALVVPPEAKIQFQFENTTGWDSYRLEMIAFTNFDLPSGWTNENGMFVYVGIDAPPPAFTLPSIDRWGKWMCFLTVNGGTRNDAFDDAMVDRSTALSMLGPTGLEDVGVLESNQFDALRGWLGPIQKALRAIGAPAAGVLPDINTSSWTLDQLGDPAGVVNDVSRYLLRRGDTVQASATLAYADPAALPGLELISPTPKHVPPTTVDVVDTLENGAATASDEPLTGWQWDEAFEHATGATESIAPATLSGLGTDAGLDPKWRSSARPSIDIAGSATMLARRYRAKEVSFEVIWTSDVYVGTDYYATLTQNSSIVEGTINGEPGVQGTWKNFLRPTLQIPQTTFTPNANTVELIDGTHVIGEYVYFLAPDTDQYRRSASFSIPMVMMGTLTLDVNGSERTYRVWRSTQRFSSPVTVSAGPLTDEIMWA